MSVDDQEFGETVAGIAAALAVLEKVVAVLVKRLPAEDLSYITKILEETAVGADAANAKQVPGLEEELTHQVNSQSRKFLELIRKTP